jgi:hypothetical protein
MAQPIFYPIRIRLSLHRTIKVLVQLLSMKIQKNLSSLPKKRTKYIKTPLLRQIANGWWICWSRSNIEGPENERNLEVFNGEGDQLGDNKTLNLFELPTRYVLEGYGFYIQLGEAQRVCNACFIDDGRLGRPFTKGPTAKY